MKPYLPLLSLVLLAACSTSYQNRQTPDDVYFSPAPPRVEYAKVEKKDDRRYDGTRNEELALEDRYLQMKTRNRRYALLDVDCDCYGYTGNNYNRYYDYYRFNDWRYNRWSFNTWNPNFTYYSPYYYNPYYANPYYGGFVVGNTRPVYNQPRKGNLNIYNGSDNGNTGSYSKPRNNSSNSDAGNYRNSGTDAGTNLRNTFGGSSNNSGSSNSSNSGASSPSRSSSSSGSSNAPVRKF